MSVVERGAPVSARPSSRFLRSELQLIFGRRRNIAGLGVLAAVPILIALAVKYAGSPGAGEGPTFLSQATSNGLFVGLASLTVEIPLFLPLAVAAISADAVAGEANLGTLRYLLTVPVGRARLLAVKYLAVVLFTVVAVLVVAIVGAGLGIALFGAGPATLLSGTQVTTVAALGRLALVCVYLSICLAGLAAIGVFVSTLTEQPLGATIAVVGLAVISQILDSISQLSAIHAYLPTHYWLDFGDLLRAPIETSLIWRGVLSAVVYAVVFGTAAWARFADKDVTS